MRLGEESKLSSNYNTTTMLIRQALVLVPWTSGPVQSDIAEYEND